jgi:hypothetical protein
MSSATLSKVNVRDLLFIMQLVMPVVCFLAYIVLCVVAGAAIFVPHI